MQPAEGAVHYASTRGYNALQAKKLFERFEIFSTFRS